MAVVFSQGSKESPLHDLLIDGRAAEYDVEPQDFGAAIKRQRGRIKPGSVIYVEDYTGYRTRLGR